MYTSVCNNTVVMWPLFFELIVSFYVKITQGIFLYHRENSGKTQGMLFWLECGHPGYVLLFSSLHVSFPFTRCNVNRFLGHER